MNRNSFINRIRRTFGTHDRKLWLATVFVAFMVFVLWERSFADFNPVITEADSAIKISDVPPFRPGTPTDNDIYKYDAAKDSMIPEADQTGAGTGSEDSLSIYGGSSWLSILNNYLRLRFSYGFSIQSGDSSGVDTIVVKSDTTYGNIVTDARLEDSLTGRANDYEPANADLVTDVILEDSLDRYFDTTATRTEINLIADDTANYQTAYGWGNHTGLYAPILPDTTEFDTAMFREWVFDKVKEFVTGNTETGISVTSDDADNTLDFDVTLGTSIATSEIVDSNVTGDKLSSAVWASIIAGSSGWTLLSADSLAMIFAVGDTLFMAADTVNDTIYIWASHGNLSLGSVAMSFFDSLTVRSYIEFSETGNLHLDSATFDSMVNLTGRYAASGFNVGDSLDYGFTDFGSDGDYDVDTGTQNSVTGIATKAFSRDSVGAGGSLTYTTETDSGVWSVFAPIDPNTGIKLSGSVIVGDPGLAEADSLVAYLLYLQSEAGATDSLYYISTQDISDGEHCLYYVTVADSPDSAYWGSCTGGAGGLDSAEIMTIIRDTAYVDSALTGVIVRDTADLLYEPLGHIDSSLVGPIIRDTADLLYEPINANLVTDAILEDSLNSYFDTTATRTEINLLADDTTALIAAKDSILAWDNGAGPWINTLPELFSFFDRDYFDTLPDASGDSIKVLLSDSCDGGAARAELADDVDTLDGGIAAALANRANKSAQDSTESWTDTIPSVATGLDTTWSAFQTYVTNHAGAGGADSAIIDVGSGTYKSSTVKAWSMKIGGNMAITTPTDSAGIDTFTISATGGSLTNFTETDVGDSSVLAPVTNTWTKLTGSVVVGDPGLAEADSILAYLLYLKSEAGAVDSTYYISPQDISDGEHCLYYVTVAAGPDSVYFGSCTGGAINDSLLGVNEADLLYEPINANLVTDAILEDSLDRYFDTTAMRTEINLIADDTTALIAAKDSVAAWDNAAGPWIPSSATSDGYVLIYATAEPPGWKKVVAPWLTSETGDISAVNTNGPYLNGGGTSGAISLTLGKNALAGALDGAGLIVTDSELVANPDGATLELSGDYIQVKASGIGSTHIANGAIDAMDIKATSKFVAVDYFSYDSTVAESILVTDKRLQDSLTGRADDYEAANANLVTDAILTDSLNSYFDTTATRTEINLIADDTANFLTAYGWGNHSAQNYLDNDDANIDTAAWNAAAGGGWTSMADMFPYFDPYAFDSSVGGLIIFQDTAVTSEGELVDSLTGRADDYATSGHDHSGTYEPASADLVTDAILEDSLDRYFDTTAARAEIDKLADDSATWNTAYGWGDWSGEGFITAGDVAANETDAAALAAVGDSINVRMVKSVTGNTETMIAVTYDPLDSTYDFVADTGTQSSEAGLSTKGFARDSSGTALTQFTETDQGDSSVLAPVTNTWVKITGSVIVGDPGKATADSMHVDSLGATEALIGGQYIDDADSILSKVEGDATYEPINANLVTDAILTDSLNSYSDTAAVVDTIQGVLTSGQYLTEADANVDTAAWNAGSGAGGLDSSEIMTVIRDTTYIDSALTGVIVRDTSDLLYEPLGHIDSALVGVIVRDTADLLYQPIGIIDSALIGVVVRDTSDLLYEPLGHIDSSLVGPIIRDTADLLYEPINANLVTDAILGDSLDTYATLVALGPFIDSTSLDTIENAHKAVLSDSTDGGAARAELADSCDGGAARAELADDVDTAGTDIAAALADRANIHDTLTISFTISLIDDTWDWGFRMFPKAITIIAASGICFGGTNVIGCLMEYDNDGANPAVCNSSDWTFTTGEERTTSLSNASIDAGDYLGWKTTSVSGVVDKFTLTIEYTVN